MESACKPIKRYSLGMIRLCKYYTEATDGVATHVRRRASLRVKPPLNESRGHALCTDRSFKGTNMKPVTNT